jgi:uncharacterized ferritin-like protein (DUF455 family)
MIGIPSSTAALAALVSFERLLLTTAAEHIARSPSLPTKMFLCRMVWAAALRTRALCRALPPEVAAFASASRPDSNTENLVRTLTATTEEALFVAGLCHVVLPFAAGAYASAVAACRIDVGARELSCIPRDLRRIGRARRYARLRRSWDVHRHVQRLGRLAEHGRVELGEQVRCDIIARTSAEVVEPVRERAIAALRSGEVREEAWFVSSPADESRYLHQLIAFEINTFEAVSRHIAEFAGMPWEFHWDMASQIHDELTHLEMWLERLARTGGRLGHHPLSTHEFRVCTGQHLSGRLALLERLVEASALDSLDLHRCLWSVRANAIMVAYLNRVQIDEIGHVRRGNKWLRRLCGGDREVQFLVDRAEAATRRRMLASARRLEREGVVPKGNAELMRRKFDDPLQLEVNRAARLQAGFTEAEIAAERARRHASFGRGVAQEGEPS